MLNQILQNCTVSGNIVKLPDGQLDRKSYLEVKKALEGIGEKWQGGKVSGFVFPADPSPRLDKIRGGEKINLKKDFQFFATPAPIADQLVDLAELNPSHWVLEPSAGDGAIIQAIYRQNRQAKILYCELMPENRAILVQKFPNAELICPDFYRIEDHLHKGKFSRIIANPPFSKNQDIDHVLHMWEQLALGGILVSITSTHWRHSSNSKESYFRDWLEHHNAGIIPLDPGLFKESGTLIPTLIIKLRKEESNA